MNALIFISKVLLSVGEWDTRNKELTCEIHHNQLQKNHIPP